MNFIKGLPIHFERFVLVVAGVLGVIVPFLPWYRLTVANQPQLSQNVQGTEAPLGWIVLALFAGMVAVALLLGDRTQPLRAAGKLPVILCFVVSGLTLFLTIISFISNNNEAEQMARFGIELGIHIGFILVLLAAIAVAAAPFVGKYAGAANVAPRPPQAAPAMPQPPRAATPPPPPPLPPRPTTAPPPPPPPPAPAAPAPAPVPKPPAPAAPPVGMIVGAAGMYAGQSIPIASGDELIIGRDPSLANIIVDHMADKVSRKHCSVRFNAANNTYMVTDYSSNGTSVDGGSRLVANVPTSLQRGTVIALGSRENLFRLT